MRIRIVAAAKNTQNTLKALETFDTRQMFLLCHSRSNAAKMNITRVKTWKARPARAILTPASDAPFEVEDIAPPTACSTRDTISQGMKIQ